ncbi:hypothetical protein C8Q75DRAFT_370701 [Abortiporus biennis]|nr:hypothetical protein C8Q75DRAFT_370701 [Abortiporus biennis]
MPSRHPFATAQYLRNSRSTDTFNRTTTYQSSWIDVERVPPVPPLPRIHTSTNHSHAASNSLDDTVESFLPSPSPVPTDPLPKSFNVPAISISRSTSEQPTSRKPRPLPRLPTPKLSINLPQLSTKNLHFSLPSFPSTSTTSSFDDTAGHYHANASPGHYVKHSSRFTLLLSGQDDIDRKSDPTYYNGNTIDGILAIPRTSGLLSLEIKVEATIRLKEVAGAGDYIAEMLNETLYSWDTEQHSPVPSKINFQYTLPSHYINKTTGARHRLPPTYTAHLSGIPGFTVDVGYAIVVNIHRVRDRTDWWRKSSKLRVPFRYHERSRPAQCGPFPLSPEKTSRSPQTLFTFALRSRRKSRPNLEVHLFLPASRVCTLKEPIPFFLTLFGDEESLEPFAAHHTPHSSFHPISEPDSILGSSLAGTLGHQFQRSSIPSHPIRIQLQRRTTVDANAAGMGAFSKEKSHMVSSKFIGQGIIHSSTRNLNSITWSGTITVPSKVTIGGFSVSGIKVMDCIVVNILPPDSTTTYYMAFNEAVPIRLTSEPYDCHSASVTVSDWE